MHQSVKTFSSVPKIKAFTFHLQRDFKNRITAIFHFIQSDMYDMYEF